MSRRWLSHVKGDVAGGFTAAVLIVPMSMGYGILALSPLGDAFVPQGLLAGLLSAVAVSLTAVLLGAEATIIYAPGSIVALLIGSIVLHTILDGRAASAADPGRTLSLVFLVVFLAGLLQACSGGSAWEASSSTSRRPSWPAFSMRPPS